MNKYVQWGYVSRDIKHTCSWNDKLIALRTQNRQAKIFLRRACYNCSKVKIKWKATSVPFVTISAASLIIN